MHWRTELPLFKSGIATPEARNEPLYFCFAGSQLVLSPNPGPWSPLTQNELRGVNVPVESEHYLGELNESHCFAVSLLPNIPLGPGFSLVGLRQMLGQIDEEYFYIAGRALQILDWDRQSRHCGGCGAPTRTQKDRSKICDQCRFLVYPRLSPSIIAPKTKDP